MGGDDLGLSIEAIPTHRRVVTFAAEIRRRQQLGTLIAMGLGRLTLAEYVVGTWCEAYASQLSPKTWLNYRQLLNKHILPSLGPLELRAIRPEAIARWQAERLTAGHGRVSVRCALTLLGAILLPDHRSMKVVAAACMSDILRLRRIIAHRVSPL